MDFTRNLKSILQTQKNELRKFEDELAAIEKADILNNYENLEKKITALETELGTIKLKNAELRKECSSLKESLLSEMYSQKLRLLNYSKQRVYKLYGDFALDNAKRLKEIEDSAEQNLAKLNESMVNEDFEIKQEIQNEITKTKKRVYEYKLNREKVLEQTGAGYSEIHEKEFAGLRESQMTEEQIQKRIANTSIEMKLGRRITNIAGIVFVLIGVALGLQYTFTNLITSVYVKSGAAFFLGLIFLVCGELMNRRNRSVFSLGITAGGTAILFTVTGISFFLLKIIPLPFAFGLTVLISAAAFLLALRYKSQTIAVFAYIGAFLPVFSASQDQANILVLLVYIVILNLFVLLLYTKKDWSILKYISFSLNLLSFFTLILMGRDTFPFIVPAVFVTLNYLMYVFIPLANFRSNVKTVSTGSSVILTINTLFSAGLMFLLLRLYQHQQFYGLCALVMAAFFTGLGYFIFRKIHDRHLLVLFLGTAFIFAVLVIPMQFDSEWISLGWLAEATGLLIIGILLKNKWFKLGGLVIYLFSIFTFILVDYMGVHDAYYIGKAGAICLSGMAILITGIGRHRGEPDYMNTFDGRYLRIFINAVIVLWFLFFCLLNDYFFPSWKTSTLFYINLVYICFTFSFAFNFIRPLKGIFTRVFQAICAFLGIIFILYLNTADLTIPRQVFVLLANALAAVLGWLLINNSVKKGKVSREAQSIIVAVFVLVLILQILVCQYDYAFNSMVISIILVLTSLALIIFGFVRRYSYLRRFGLAINFISIIKFFILDLYFLNRAERIVSYFILGFVLIGISYVYQHFSKKIFKQNEDDET